MENSTNLPGMIVMHCIKKGFLVPGILFIFINSPLMGDQKPQKCTYWTWEWNTKKKRSENHRQVQKDYSKLSDIEKEGRSDCTVCEEDQVWIRINGVKPFRVCKYYETNIRTALKEITATGFPLLSVTAYRVGKSKGPVDKNGRRTQFSNHSFGTAIDINRDLNGLYDNCSSFGKQCKLRLGGEWNPQRPGTITKNSVVTKAFKSVGLKWGGEIKGRQKDFMHFSLTGY